jgi:hypothetical protein
MTYDTVTTPEAPATPDDDPSWLHSPRAIGR